jgi:hypothetical protein
LLEQPNSLLLSSLTHFGSLVNKESFPSSLLSPSSFSLPSFPLQFSRIQQEKRGFEILPSFFSLESEKREGERERERERKREVGKLGQRRESLT